MEESEIESWFEDQKRKAMGKFVSAVNTHRQKLIAKNTPEGYKSKEQEAKAYQDEIARVESAYKRVFLAEMEKIRHAYQRLHDQYESEHKRQADKKKFVKRHFGRLISYLHERKALDQERRELNAMQRKRKKLAHLIAHTLPRKRKVARFRFALWRFFKPTRKYYVERLYQPVDWFARPVRRRYQKIAAFVARYFAVLKRLLIKGIAAGIKQGKLLLVKLAAIGKVLSGWKGKAGAFMKGTTGKGKSAVKQLLAKKESQG
ncbi:MAG: hypothetical protein V1735_03975 [Nanoarchaeota archaeon]